MSPLRRVWRSSWRGRLLIIGPYALVVFVGFIGFRNVESEAHQRCLDRKNDREVMRTVVDVATQSTNGVVLDLTKIPGYDDLDPKTQSYLKALSEGLSHSTPSSRQALHDELLAKLPPISC